MRENACEPASQPKASIAVDKNVFIHFAVDKIVQRWFVGTILSQLRQLRRMCTISVWCKSASLGQNGLSWDKIVSTYFYGTILSHDWIYETNRNQACRASSHASKATNGGRCLKMYSVLNNYFVSTVFFNGCPLPRQRQNSGCPSTCTRYWDENTRIFERLCHGLTRNMCCRVRSVLYI